MMRSRSLDIFADICTNFAKLLRFDTLMQDEDDIAFNIYKNEALLNTGEIEDGRPLTKEEYAFNRKFYPVKLERSRMNHYRVLDDIFPQQRVALIKKTKTGKTNFRMHSQGVPGITDLTSKVTTDFQVKPREQFFRAMEERRQKLKRSRMAAL